MLIEYQSAFLNDLYYRNGNTLQIFQVKNIQKNEFCLQTQYDFPLNQLMEQKPKLAFGEINFKNLEQFKIITQKTLPVTYSDNFYFNIVKYQDFSAIGYYNDIAVGAITARLEEVDQKQTAYIMTFGVLEPYRRFGFGSQLLNELIKRISQYNEIRTIYLHMWIANEIGFEFYKKHGFEKTKYKRNYYTDIQPPHCYILTKRLYPDIDPPIEYTEEDADPQQQEK